MSTKDKIIADFVNDCLKNQTGENHKLLNRFNLTLDEMRIHNKLTEEFIAGNIPAITPEGRKFQTQAKSKK